ncbi:hypothetical protein N836_10435 [Leptolyngbya sp. Heron Island J]|nr:hypothetical protein N836_10435 [Leptolyngbya sp. Heron Island J]
MVRPMASALSSQGIYASLYSGNYAAEDSRGELWVWIEATQRQALIRLIAWLALSKNIAPRKPISSNLFRFCRDNSIKSTLHWALLKLNQIAPGVLPL